MSKTQLISQASITTCFSTQAAGKLFLATSLFLLCFVSNDTLSQEVITTIREFKDSQTSDTYTLTFKFHEEERNFGTEAGKGEKMVLVQLSGANGPHSNSESGLNGWTETRLPQIDVYSEKKISELHTEWFPDIGIPTEDGEHRILTPEHLLYSFPNENGVWLIQVKREEGTGYEEVLSAFRLEALDGVLHTTKCLMLDVLSSSRWKRRVLVLSYDLRTGIYEFGLANTPKDIAWMGRLRGHGFYAKPREFSFFQNLSSIMSDAIAEIEQQEDDEIDVYRPPSLRVNPESIKLDFGDRISARSENILEFEVENLSDWYAGGLVISASMEGDTSGIMLLTGSDGAPFLIEPQGSLVFPMMITTNEFTKDGIVKIRVEVVEPRGFSTAPFSVDIPVESFKEPSIEVTDHASPLPIWSANTPIALDILIQNIGRGDASEVAADLSLPDGVFCFSGNQSHDIGTLAKGEVYKLTYDLMIPRTYVGSDVTIGIQLSESYKQYGSQWNQSFPFQGSAEETVVIVQKGQQDKSQDSGVVRATLGTATNESGEVIFSRTNSSRDVQAIAVIPKDGENCSGRTISGDDLAVFGETAMLGLYTVVDRKFFEQTLEEIKLSMTGLTFENGVLEAGCIENAQGYLFVEHGCLQNQETIKAKLIHCESSEIIWNGLGQGTSAKETFEEIVSKLEGR